MVRLSIWGAALALLTGGAASAADLPAPAPVPYFALPYSWTGIYAGLQGGYSAESDQTREFYTAGKTYTGVTFRYHPDTGIIGGHLGAMYQFGSIVVGVEGDGEGVHIRGGFNDAGGRTPSDPGGVGHAKRDWQASIRGRVGYAFDRVLVYATGGAAFSEFNYFFYNPVAKFGEGTSTTRTGWTVGGGVSYALTDNVLLGLEYRRTDYGRFDYVARSAFLGLTGEQSPVSDSVRAIVSYKF